MQCSTTILTKQEKILHNYTLTQNDIKQACRNFANVPRDCEVEVYVVNGELVGKVMHIVTQGKGGAK